MKNKKILKEVISQHFKIIDDLTNENIEDAMDNYVDRLLEAKIIVLSKNIRSNSPTAYKNKKDTEIENCKCGSRKVIIIDKSFYCVDCKSEV